jgi:hypothetical protein
MTFSAQTAVERWALDEKAKTISVVLHLASSRKPMLLES